MNNFGLAFNSEGSTPEVVNTFIEKIQKMKITNEDNIYTVSIDNISYSPRESSYMYLTLSVSINKKEPKNEIKVG